MTGAQMHFGALLDRLLVNLMAQNKPKDDIDFPFQGKVKQIKMNLNVVQRLER